MSITTILNECDDLLGDGSENDSHIAELCKKAKDRINVLGMLAKSVCDDITSNDSGNPVMNLSTCSKTNTLICGIDNVHKTLRQAVPDADDVVKQMSVVKKGPYKNLNTDIESQIYYTEPIGWAVVPALKVIVNTLRELEELTNY
ncbi:hypothetical protein TetV_383 [Tetraselmis virus 1]|uniref:Uncharacterized protein n=1 Tax=Tetraselmis virus 1 TaxID=2060617 RepID=A0A2P0VNJ8_9VIRU|nr:hypothetical protein QJ968_gp383 [Tetraselmis virus 1]AUF82475.1 hypothetical protein TetV_383 [Tetraselmis virus 1]